MGGGGSSGRGAQSQGPVSTTQQTIFPPEVQALFKFITPELQRTLEAAPLSGFLAPRPQAIAALTPEQTEALRYFRERQAAEPLYAPEVEALRQLAGTVSSEPGQSPATVAMRDYLEQVYQTQTLPALQREAELAGLGHSGALVESVRRARGDVAGQLVPVLLDEQARRDAATRALFDVGNVLETRGATRAKESFDAGESARQLEQQKFTAELADFLRQQDIVSGVTGAVTGSLLPASLTNVTNTSGVKMKTSQDQTGGGLLWGALSGRSK